jgi:6-phosphogluconolactonase
MKSITAPDPDEAAKLSAEIIAREAVRAISDRGKFVLALSGGRAPWQMLREFASKKLAWDKVHIVQVDERVAPDGDPIRNWTHIRESLAGAPLSQEQFHPMPVTSPDLAAAAREYSATLEKIAGSPPVVDLAHLGLGPDGHTASLVPGDPVLNVADADVAITGEYQGRLRMTLTYPTLNRAKVILWLVTGGDKVDALGRLLRQDPSIPAGRVEQANAMLVADRAAAGEP